MDMQGFKVGVFYMRVLSLILLEYPRMDLLHLKWMWNIMINFVVTSQTLIWLRIYY